LSKLSHIDPENRPTMVDVSDKEPTVREAHAQTVIRLPRDIAQHISGEEIETKKGPVFATAIIAGVMAAKKTHELIPFCHPIGLDS
jgi:cyclic pyranopterin phosphate synthase